MEHPSTFIVVQILSGRVSRPEGYEKARPPVLSALCSIILLLAVQQGGGQPVFREEPQNLTVVVGAAARLQCAVEGLTGETVQWAKDGLLLGPDRSLPGFPRYSMAGRQTGGEYHLKIERASLEDESLFECQVGGSESSGPLVSPPVWLTVLVPPAQCLVMVDAADEPWMFGEEYTVTCLATDAKPAAQITVFRGGVEVTEFDSSEMSGSEDKLSNTEVTVRVVAESGDNGRQFQCVANSDALLTPLKTSFTMSVLFPPQPPVIEGMDSEEVKAGTTLQLLCTSRGGNPVATLHWTKNDELLSSSWEVDKQAVVARSSVTLTVKAEDNGAQLTCESTNPASPSPLLNTITLNVVFLPSEVHVAGSLSATEGKNITLSCSTTSSRPPVLIRWWLGARQLDASSVTVTEGSHGGMVTMSNLTHTVSREENGLPLICEAFNQAVRFSRTQSNPLRVYYPPQKVWIEAPPQGTKLRSGSTLHLVCFSSGGNPPGRLTWLKDNKSAREMQTAVQSEKGVSRELVLLLQPSDNQATYRCNATNDAKGPPLSAHTKLHVQFPAVSVKISVTPKEVRRGQTLTLDCVAGSSNPVANISWVMGGQKLQGVPRGQQGAEFGGVSVRSRLSLQVWSAHSGRKVSCQAYSPVLAEGVNTFHTLNVLYPPEFDPDQPREVQAVEGGMALLPVKVSANPNDISYNWTHRGHFLVKERAQRHRMQPGGALEIWNVTRADAGNYTIICNNAEGENRTILCLDILYAPTITHLAVRTEADLGQPAEIVCTANANPTNPDMFSWTWLGEEEGSLSEDTQQAVQGATGRLLLPEVQRSHSGQYRCQVDNGIAPPASADVWLIVRFKPEIHKGVQWSKVASRGDGSGTAEVVCQAEGVPRVQFDWAKNGKTLDLSDPRYSEQTVRDGALHTSRVMIVNVSAALDYALFTCTASNSLGQDTLDIQLLSTDRPDPPSGLKVIGVTHHSISLQWAPGFDGGLKQSFRVRYRRKDALSSQYVDVFPPQATSFTVTGLRSATSYNLSIIALNELGESRYTDHDAMLTTVTEESDLPHEEKGEEEVEPPAESPGWPLYRVVTVAVVGGVLLLLNSALGVCVARIWTKGRRERALSEGKKSEMGSCMTEPNQYGRGERLNSAAHRTLLIDSASEPDSSLYENYEQGSAPYRYPASVFRTSLPPHPESAEGYGNDTHGILGGYNTRLATHDYEDVRDWGEYEDLGAPPSFPLPPSNYYPRVVGVGGRSAGLQDTHTQGVYQRRGWNPPEPEEPIRVYDTVAEYRPPGGDHELPFELRGELV